MKKTIPRVAIITRTRDRGILLERAIQSVHNQTMQDFVHVIINDAGDPGVVDTLIEKYKPLIKGRVKVVHNKSSNGMEAASNKAIRSVESMFIAIHDDDDTWHPDFLKMTTEYLEATGDKGVVVTTDKIDEEIVDGNTIKKINQARWLPDVRTIGLYRQCLDNYATPITFLYRREVYDELGGYDETLPVAGDWDFALRFLLKHDIYYLLTKEALAYYHHRASTDGVNQNSVFLNNGLLHEQKINTIMNKYLRSELEKGTLGLGYLISSVHEQKSMVNNINRHVSELIDTNVVRLEGHINYTSDKQIQEIRLHSALAWIRRNVFKRNA